MQLQIAHLSQRVAATHLRGAAALAEASIQAALRGDGLSACQVEPPDVAPVWLWVGAGGALTCGATRNAGAQDSADSGRTNSAEDKQRRRTERAQEGQGRNAMVLPFRGEALMSWSEMVRVNRSTDDEDDGNAVAAANDMVKLSLAPGGQTLASCVKFDLDLPSTSADDLTWIFTRGATALRTPGKPFMKRMPQACRPFA